MPDSQNSVKNLTRVRTLEALRQRVAAWRADGAKTGFVPTMGALHEGHLALVREARRLADRVVVSIFVNPLQFAPTEDLDRYPRDEAGDVALLQGVGCDLVYLPTRRCCIRRVSSAVSRWPARRWSWKAISGRSSFQAWRP